MTLDSGVRENDQNDTKEKRRLACVQTAAVVPLGAGQQNTNSHSSLAVLNGRLLLVVVTYRSITLL